MGVGVLDAYASRPNYLEHLLAVWAALPPARRGRLHVAHRKLAWRAHAAGFEADWAIPQGPGPLTLVAAHSDYTQVHHDRPIVYLEHGSGQTYRDYPWFPAYSGGTGRDRVVLFLTLNETTAARERTAYPNATVAVVGSPRLDRLAQIDDARGSYDCPPPVVAFAFHWHWNGVPETRDTFPHWRAAVAGLARSGVTVLGHGHPRAFGGLVRWYERHGIEAVAEFDDVVARADVLCLDNTSAGPEFAAATGRPLVWLDAPWYRRDVEHGGRFWEWPAGQVSCSDPADLPAAVRRALDDPITAAAARARMVRSIYPPSTRGISGELAVAAVESTLDAAIST